MDRSSVVWGGAGDQFEKASTTLIAMIAIGQSSAPVIETTRIYAMLPTERSTTEATIRILINDTLPVRKSFLSCHNRRSFLFH